MGQIIGPSDTPRSVVERAADVALLAAAASLQSDKAEGIRLFITLRAKNVPDGEMDCATGGRGYDEAEDLLAELLTVVSGIAEQLGLQVSIIPMSKGIGEG